LYAQKRQEFLARCIRLCISSCGVDGLISRPAISSRRLADVAHGVVGVMFRLGEKVIQVFEFVRRFHSEDFGHEMGCRQVRSNNPSLKPMRLTGYARFPELSPDHRSPLFMRKQLLNGRHDPFITAPIHRVSGSESIWRWV